jgi:DNA-binding response OmpR family regulator
MNRPLLLVVDDDPYTRSALHTLFTRRGWHVLLADTVTEGMTLLDPAPCCAILDLNLPDGGGEAILRVIRARCPKTRVAVCSGADDPMRLEVVRGLGPELMLRKPYDLAPLFQLCGVAMAASA